MLASELVEQLQAWIERVGDAPVLVDVVWPHEMYDVPEDEPICRGGTDDKPVLLLQTSDLVVS